MKAKRSGGTLRVLMLGWEFPPFISGGLGTACYGLTRALDRLGVEVIFVLPRMVASQYATHVRLLTPGSKSCTRHVSFHEFQNVTFRTVSSPLQPYSGPELYRQRIEQTLRQKQQGRTPVDNAVGGIDYKGDMYAEVHRYAAVAAELARGENFDLVHAHDWMTYPAGIAVAAMSRKPLVVHLHSSEFDRSGQHVNQMIYDIERRGLETADRVIAVSHFTRNIIVGHYGISPTNVEVVHKRVERNGNGQ